MTDASRSLSLTQCYDELKQLAQARLGRLPPGQTLQATALVHEAWMRLEKRGGLEQEDRARFFRNAALAMRDILVEAARAKSRIKRGGDRKREAGDPDEFADLDRFELSVLAEDLLSLHDLLERLAEVHERQAQVVLLKWFSGLEHEEIAELMELSVRTVERDWRFAKAWLYERLDQERSSTDG